MIYTKEFAFIHIPKTSGMSIKKSIELNCPDAKYMPENTFSETFEGFDVDWRRIMHCPYSYWEPLIKDKWVFSIVRNPFIRAVSFYVFLKTTYSFSDMCQDLTFEELYSTPIINNSTVTPTTTQTEYLTGNNNVIVPNIFKYENGYTDIEQVLGFKIDQTENITPVYNYLDYYDEKREKLILNLFEEDFENFSYNTNLG
jgi:hypothetical protein|tara:strand:- start:176 stop:772 length:597 start_codon:yes stop_codon:yes gene_type:complete